jgi:hypothetical protein
MSQKETLPALTSDDLKKLLLDGGVMFEINRAVLHKFGYSFFVSMDDKSGKLTQMGIIKNGDYEGTIFDPETFKHGTKKYEAFENAQHANLESRKKACGWLNQDQPFQVANAPEVKEIPKADKKSKAPEKKAQAAPPTPCNVTPACQGGYVCPTHANPREMTVPGRPALKLDISVPPQKVDDHDHFMTESEE